MTAVFPYIYSKNPAFARRAWLITGRAVGNGAETDSNTKSVVTIKEVDSIFSRTRHNLPAAEPWKNLEAKRNLESLKELHLLCKSSQNARNHHI